MRTRTKHNINSSIAQMAAGISYTNTHHKCDGTTSASSASSSFLPQHDINISSESITDSTGKGKSHGCRHKKTSRIISLINAASWPHINASYGSFDYGSIHERVLWYQTMNAVKLSNSDVLTSALPANWSLSVPQVSDSVVFNDLSEKARQLKADVLLNIIEANQIWPSLKSLALSLPRLRQFWPILTRKQLLVHASSNYLAWKFGISPIISDLTNIAKFAPDMQRQYKQFMRTENQRFSKTFEGTLTYQRPAEYGVANGVTYATHTFQSMSLESPQVRYVLVIKPNVSKYLTEGFQQLDFLMRRFTTSPARLAWEKIPFSFVSDWFVDIRGLLDKFDNLLGVSPFKVLSFTKSIKTHINTRQYVRLTTTCSSPQLLFDGLVCEIDETCYERSLASGNQLISWKPRFGKSQAAITAALIGQQLRRLRT